MIGNNRTRTYDIIRAKHAFYQLNYVSFENTGDVNALHGLY